MVSVVKMSSGRLGWLLERLTGRQFTCVCVLAMDVVVTGLARGDVALGEVV